MQTQSTHESRIKAKREKGYQTLNYEHKNQMPAACTCFILSILSRLNGNLLISAVKTSILSIRWHWIGWKRQQQQTSVRKQKYTHARAELDERIHTKSRVPKWNAQLWKLCANSLGFNLKRNHILWMWCIICFYFSQPHTHARTHTRIHTQNTTSQQKQQCQSTIYLHLHCRLTFYCIWHLYVYFVAKYYAHCSTPSHSCTPIRSILSVSFIRSL